MAQFNARRVMDWLPVRVADLIETRCREHIERPELDIDVVRRTYFDEVDVRFANGQRIVVRFYVQDAREWLLDVFAHDDETEEYIKAMSVFKVILMVEAHFCGGWAGFVEGGEFF